MPNQLKIKKDECFSSSTKEKEREMYYKINKEIKIKYNINLISREIITKNIISILTQGNYDSYETLNLDTIIIRTAIKKFYQSINKHLLYQKISRSNDLNKETLDILKPLFFSKSIKGVPPDLPFSNLLSEIFLEELDRNIIVNFNPSFYYRYVDDIIIIIHGKYSNSKNTFKEKKMKILKEIFSESSLEIDQDKTIFTYNKTKGQPREELEFEYLDYHFKSTPEVPNSRILKIDIAEKKVETIFNKITHFFGIYRKGNKQNIDFWKLYYRLQNMLYGITSLKRNGETIKFGMGFLYQFINTDEQFSKILKYIKHNIFTCGLSSREQYILFKLIDFESSPLEVLNRRYDYRNITLNQFKKINKRLNIESNINCVESLFLAIYDNKCKSHK